MKLAVASRGLFGLVLVQVASVTAETTTLVYPPWSHCYGMHRVTQTHLTLRAGFKHRFDDPQGMAAIKLEAEDDPTSRRDDDELTVFGVNSGQNQLIYNTSITQIGFYGQEGDGVGGFRNPHGVAVDRDGFVIVADTGNDRLHVLRYADDGLHHIRFIAGRFAGDRLQEPRGVALEGGEIYVCDPPHGRVLVLDLEGHLLRVLRPEHAGRPILVEPFGVAVIRRDQDLNFFGEDFVVVTDSAWTRLWKLDRKGNVLTSRTLDQVAPGGGEFYYPAIDYHANVYCTDRTGKLHKFDRELRHLLSIGQPGRGDHEFDEPRGIGVYRRFGQIFVAEKAGAQYLWIGTDVFTPSLTQLRALPDGVWSGQVRFFLTEYARVSLVLVDEKSEEHAVLQSKRWTQVGPVTRAIRFRRPEGPGPFRIQVEAEPLYSSRKFLKVQKTTRPLALGDP